MRINLWASPRNRSTAIMYSFGERSDMSIVDEPFYAHYLAKSGLHHPMRLEVMQTQSSEKERVIKEVYNKKYPTPHVFFKQMSHHLSNDEPQFAVSDKNIILVRDPKAMILSFSKVMERPSIEDLGLMSSAKLFDFFQSNGQVPIVLDTGILMDSPREILHKLCDELGLSFDVKMLSWKPGPRKEDGIWAAVWYGSVHQSTGLHPQKSQSVRLPKKYAALYRQCMPDYSFLRDQSIQ
ncbi:MAG: hypothetical protein CMO34_04375 [Verrucomicrobia bacterium]|nr:hypothetical protein [Verrucomicrobiota bacterium]